MRDSAPSDEPLAALADKPEADRVIAGLKAEGAYDPDRRIRPHDETRLELPIARIPEETGVEAVIEQADPPYRVRTLDEYLAQRGWPPERRRRVPSSWAVIGSVIVGRFEDCPAPETVGQALLELHGNADTVISLASIEGMVREPSIRILAGTGETETIHVEHGTAYGLDLAEVMFSPGNQAERVRMGSVVEPDERVFDMFAGIGYFSLPMARGGARVLAAECNPTAYDYLCENAVRNAVTDRLDPCLQDCRSVETSADRVVMGHYQAVSFLPSALSALRPGGRLHLHHLGPFEEGRAALAAEARAAGRELTVLDERVVKTHSPGLAHRVLDAQLW